MMREGTCVDHPTPQHTMKVSVEAVSLVKKSVRIEVPPDAVIHTFNHVLADLQARVQLPGFRKGKTPLPLLLKKYEATLQSETLEDLIREYYPKGIEEAGLAPLAMPQFQDVHFQKDGPFSFTALVDVMPKIERLDYKGLSLPRETVTVTENDIDQALERLREQQGYLETLPEDHSIVATDYATIGFVEEPSGHPTKGKVQETLVQIGAETTRAEITSALIGKRKGDSVSVDLALPQEDPSKAAPGEPRPTRFRLMVKEVKIKKLPPLDDELAKDVGQATLLELKEAVKRQLLASRTAEIRRDHKEKLTRRLVELHPTEAPQPMVEGEFESRMKTLPPSMQSNTEVMEILRGKAEESVKAYLILSAIADEEKIEASDTQIEEYLTQSARRKGVPLEREKRNLMQSEGSRYAMMQTIRIEQAMERVYALVQYTEQESEVAC